MSHRRSPYAVPIQSRCIRILSSQEVERKILHDSDRVAAQAFGTLDPRSTAVLSAPHEGCSIPNSPASRTRGNLEREAAGWPSTVTQAAPTHGALQSSSTTQKHSQVRKALVRSEYRSTIAWEITKHVQLTAPNWLSSGFCVCNWVSCVEPPCTQPNICTVCVPLYNSRLFSNRGKPQMAAALLTVARLEGEA